MNFQDIITLMGCIVWFIMGIGFNEAYHLRKAKKEDKVLEFEKATADYAAKENARLIWENHQLESNAGYWKSRHELLSIICTDYLDRINKYKKEVATKDRDIEALKSKLNTDIPTLDRNSCTLSTGLTIQRVWVKPTRNDWDSIVSKCPYPDSLINTAWSKRIVYALICDLLSFHGFIHNSNGDMIRTYTGCSFSFECLSKYNSVEAFQKDWPYK